MTMPFYIEINGIKLSPKSLTCSIQDIDYDAGRTADGSMHRNKVTQKFKYEISIVPMHAGESLYESEDADLADLLNALNQETFSANMPNPLNNGELEERTYYVGDRSIPVYNFYLNLWDTVSFNIVEV